jgi:1,2-diacylglycerol 3-alpha-glucosyltransferase/glucuronosyltransferase
MLGLHLDQVDVLPKEKRESPGDHLGRRPIASFSARPMKVVMVTDTWEPEINGVVTTLRFTMDHLRELGHEVVVVCPSQFPNVRSPLIDRAVRVPYYVPTKFWQDTITPGCAVHISTEGVLGSLAKRYCIKHQIPFTTCFHTNFPEYFYDHFRIPVGLSYRYFRRFHRSSETIMVATKSCRRNLVERGFQAPIKNWSRGVNMSLFRPRPKTFVMDRPIAMYVGRLAKEKNIEAFLNCRNDVEKFVVGDGPHRAALEAAYPEAHFQGFLQGEILAEMYANADVFVFPSRTDTFGLVIVEALACGVPVAAYPVQGPIDILRGKGVGCLSENLEEAIRIALETHNPAACVALASEYTWERCTQQFREILEMTRWLPGELASGSPSQAAMTRCRSASSNATA